MRRGVWVAFAALCLLAGSGWLLEEIAPGLLAGTVRSAVHLGLLALVLGAVSLRERREPGTALYGKLALGGVAMFAVPGVLFAGAGGHVSDTTELLVFLLVPVIVVFGEAQKAAGFGARENPLRMLGPALAGIGGAALLLPFDWPGTTEGRVWLVAMVLSAVLAGLAAVRMHPLLAGAGLARAAAVIFGAASAVSAGFWRLGWTGLPAWSANAVGFEALRCLVWEGPILVLTVWLLREMKPVRFSARVLLIPLVTIAEGYVMMRPALGWTTAAGIALLAGGGAGLLLGDSREVL